MDFTPNFESSNKNQEEEGGSSGVEQVEEDKVVDRILEYLQNRNIPNIRKLMQLLVVSGVMVSATCNISQAASPKEGYTDKPEKKTERTISIDDDISADKWASQYVRERLSDDLNKEQQQKIKGEIAEILKNYGDDAIIRMDRVNEHYRDKEQDLSSVRVKGFESLNLSSEKLKDLFRDHYPDGLVDNHVMSVDYTDDAYGDLNAQNQYRPADFDPREGGQVSFYKPEQSRLKQLDPSEIASMFDIVFGHELGHAIDWVGNDNLSLAERIQLFHDAHEAFQQSKFEDGNHPAGTLEGGTHKINSDSFYELDNDQRFKMLQEWFANAVGVYFANPAEMEKFYPNAFQLVKGEISEIDSDFNPEEELNKRIEMYDSLEVKNAK